MIDLSKIHLPKYVCPLGWHILLSGLLSNVRLRTFILGTVKHLPRAFIFTGEGGGYRPCLAVFRAYFSLVLCSGVAPDGAQENMCNATDREGASQIQNEFGIVLVLTLTPTYNLWLLPNLIACHWLEALLIVSKYFVCYILDKRKCY